MSWQSKYLSALQTRDESEQSVKRVFEDCPSLPCSYTQPNPNPDTTLADRLAHLENPPVASTAVPVAPASTSPRPDGGRPGSTTERRAVAASHAAADLAEAQRARAALEAKTKELVAELEAARATAKADQRRIAELVAESQGLGKRVRDRDEELREKAKLLDVSWRCWGVSYGNADGARMCIMRQWR